MKGLFKVFFLLFIIILPNQEAWAKCLYEISGQVTVNNPYTGRNEPLAGVPVQAGGNTYGAWKYWKDEQVISDANGYFTITKEKSCERRKIRVRFKLKNNRIQVRANKQHVKYRWIKYTVAATKTNQRVFQIQANTDAASENMTKRAGIFSLVDIANKTVDAFGDGLENPNLITVIYPANSEEYPAAFSKNNTI